MPERSVRLVALGTALSATLAAIYVACAVAAVVAPALPFAHGWLTLFGGYPPLTASGIAVAVLANVVAGWFAALVFAPVYNALSGGGERRT